MHNKLNVNQVPLRHFQGGQSSLERKGPLQLHVSMIQVRPCGAQALREQVVVNLAVEMWGKKAIIPKVSLLTPVQRKWP